MEGNNRLLFTSTDCTGTAYIKRDLIQPHAHLAGTDVWYPDTSAPVAPLTTHSYRQAFTGNCLAISDIHPAVSPALNFTLPTFTPPFHLEPEPCFTPDEPTPEQFIHGCIKGNGTLKIVNDPTECSDRETPISWLGE